MLGKWQKFINVLQEVFERERTVKRSAPLSLACYFQLVYLKYFQPDSVLQKVIAHGSPAAAAILSHRLMQVEFPCSGVWGAGRAQPGCCHGATC